MSPLNLGVMHAAELNASHGVNVNIAHVWEEYAVYAGSTAQVHVNSMT